MSNQFTGEIRMFGGTFAPQGWAFCNGQQLDIAANESLFTLIGTTYGGDGQNTFALPDLRGRAPLHVSTSTSLGQVGGEERHTLTFAEMPAHAHLKGSVNQANSAIPLNAAPAAKARRGVNVFAPPPADRQINDSAASTGGNISHENMQPFLVVNFIICLEGIFPPRN